MKIFHYTCAAIALGTTALCNTSVLATPATLGYYPSTDIYGKGAWHLDVDSYGRRANTDASISTGLTYGFGKDDDSAFGRNEIGTDYILSLGDAAPRDPNNGERLSSSKRVLGNFKTQLYSNDKKGVRVVAGGWLLGNKDIYAANVGYILGSKTFKFGRIHVGLAHSFSKEETIATLDGDSDRTYLQLGYDRYLTKKIQFAVDYYSGKSSISGVQPTLYYYLNDKTSLGIGYFRLNDKDISPTRNQVYLSFDYNFGG